MSGIAVLKKIKQEYPQIEVIMITGQSETKNIIQSLRLGAFDFFRKPFRTIDIKNSIEKTQKFVKLQNKIKNIKLHNRIISQKLAEETGQQLISKSKKMAKVLKSISKVAKYDTAVLITGESGTGKELVARSIHYLSNRKDNHFYAVNCSAIPENLFESEFFGHKKGAFTDAKEDKFGWFEIADKGTLFLDEIGDMPLSQQKKFLRVLEEKSLRRVGSNTKVPIDVRIITATNKNINEMVEAKEFRLDLYHRLNTFEIKIPPLRARKDDIPVLLDYFIEQFALKSGKKISRIEEDVYHKLLDYDFKGNIRELKNLAERAVILCDNVVKTKHFNIDMTNKKNAKSEAVKPVPYIYNLEKIEKDVIQKALQKTKYNKTKAAELLGISWYALNRKMKKYNF